MIRSPEEFLSDLTQIFKNAQTYNVKNSDIWNMAKKLKQLAKREMQPLLTEASTTKAVRKDKTKSKKTKSNYYDDFEMGEEDDDGEEAFLQSLANRKKKRNKSVEDDDE